MIAQKRKGMSRAATNAADALCLADGRRVNL